MANKKLKATSSKDNTSNGKINDSELLMKHYEFLVENKIIDENSITNGLHIEYNGLDVQNIKRSWEF